MILVPCNQVAPNAGILNYMNQKITIKKTIRKGSNMSAPIGKGKAPQIYSANETPQTISASSSYSEKSIPSDYEEKQQTFKKVAQQKMNEIVLKGKKLQDLNDKEILELNSDNSQFTVEFTEQDQRYFNGRIIEIAKKELQEIDKYLPKEKPKDENCIII